jgi:hypothetical protein
LPFGIVIALPCIKRKDGAASQSMRPVTTIPAVITPAWPPPLLPWLHEVPPFRHQPGEPNPSLSPAFPPRAIRRFGCASVTVRQAKPPRGSNRWRRIRRQLWKGCRNMTSLQERDQPPAPLFHRREALRRERARRLMEGRNPASQLSRARMLQSSPHFGVS